MKNDRKTLRVVSSSHTGEVSLPMAVVSQAEYTAAQVKAGLAFNGDLPTLIRRAVAEYEAKPRMPRACPLCHKEALMVPTEAVEIVGNGVRVTGIPSLMCSECLEKLRPSVRLLSTLEEIVGDRAPGAVVAFGDLVTTAR